jgi:hypothetical protein
MVLAARDASLTEAVREQVGQGVDIVFFGEEAASAREVERYILPSLSCQDMADLALGRAVGDVPGEVLRLLLSGREVEVMEFAYQAYADSAPGPLYGLYEGYRERLAGYGLVEFRPKSPDAVRIRDSLVTGEAVRRAADTGTPVLVVPGSAIITPLARDAAENLHIRIVKAL